MVIHAQTAVEIVDHDFQVAVVVDVCHRRTAADSVIHRDRKRRNEGSVAVEYIKLGRLCPDHDLVEIIRIDIGGACRVCLAATTILRLDAICFAYAGGERMVN